MKNGNRNISLIFKNLKGGYHVFMNPVGTNSCFLNCSVQMHGSMGEGQGCSEMGKGVQNEARDLRLLNTATRQGGSTRRQGQQGWSEGVLVRNFISVPTAERAIH